MLGLLKVEGKRKKGGPRMNLFIESFLQMCIEGIGCRIGYEPTKNELRSLSAVDIQGHQPGSFYLKSRILCLVAFFVAYVCQDIFNDDDLVNSFSVTYPMTKIAGNTAAEVIQFATFESQSGKLFLPSLSTFIGGLFPNGPHDLVTIVPFG